MGNNYWVCRVMRGLRSDVNPSDVDVRVVVFKDLASRLLRAQAKLLVDLPFDS